MPLFLVISCVFFLFLIAVFLYLPTYDVPVTAPSDAHTQLQSFGMERATLGSASMQLFIADTDKERMKGLSGVRTLGKNEGVLFIFSLPGRYGFWMKDMQFSLDFIYLRDKKVVEVIKDVSPDTYPASIESRLPADSILEVKAGFVDRENIKVGDSLELDSD